MTSAKRCTCEMMVIDVDQENDRAQHSALGDSGCELDEVRFLTLNNVLLSTVIKKDLDAAQSCASDTYESSFMISFELFTLSIALEKSRFSLDGLIYTCKVLNE